MIPEDEADTRPDEVVVECEMEASPEKLWRALTQEPFLADWLGARPADEDAQGPSYPIVEAKPYSRVRYAWHDPESPDAPPAVTVELERLSAGRTWFRLTHGETTARVGGAANSNRPPLALAA
ncbi:SRPBCC domain-containing protein [Chelativorans sp. AA-79]|uniref:SRPBCC family protein n=1 Tax=Chelativorans sp. AA-79 TaxID=3028735 RepID=UPI0023F7E3EB|nr:SRPBCC domain-containing protein [Chelativorans sp. AA-79]WEX11575.1 SRPBCC domain-containing protein [Chelativorans sp. AA-79]